MAEVKMLENAADISSDRSCNSSVGHLLYHIRGYENVANVLNLD